jgi:hypothetical protein
MNRNETAHDPLLDPEQLDKTLHIKRGLLPVLITVPHDGLLRSVSGIPFISNPNSRHRDVAVDVIAQDIYEYIADRMGGITINIVSEQVHRSCATPQTRAYLYWQSAVLMQSLQATNQQALHIDLHGCSNQPTFGEFDLIVGTAHCRTVGDSDIDKRFHQFMEASGYSVYLPTGKPIDGELFGADGEHNLTGMIHRHLPQVPSMQIEISRKFRERGSKEIGQRLSRRIGDFLIDWLP